MKKIRFAFRRTYERPDSFDRITIWREDKKQGTAIIAIKGLPAMTILRRNAAEILLQWKKEQNDKKSTEKETEGTWPYEC
jgi:hypothetical protein